MKQETKQKHTPGINNEWVILERRNMDRSVYERQVLGAKNVRVAFIEGATVSEAEANARLIAAAPELLKALEDMILFVASSASVTHPDLNLKKDIVVQSTLSVISKATGVE